MEPSVRRDRDNHRALPVPPMRVGKHGPGLACVLLISLSPGGAHMLSNHRGFTLLELMIVVAMIAILAAIPLPAYHAYRLRATADAGPRQPPNNTPLPPHSPLS